MVYREIRPCPQLQPWVHCLWELEGADTSPQIIYPDGRAEIVFHYGDAFIVGGAKQAKALFAGQLTAAITVVPSGVAGVFGVRFTPAGAWAVLRFSQSQTSNKIIPLGDVCQSFERSTGERIFNAQDTSARVRIIEDALCAMAPDRPANLELCATSIIEAKMTSRDAQRSLGIGERHWERLVQERTGLRPKLLERIGRFRRALQLSREGRAWANIAHDCNYTDQPHLVREFREFTGTPPTRVDADLFG